MRNTQRPLPRLFTAAIISSLLFSACTNADDIEPTPTTTTTVEETTSPAPSPSATLALEERTFDASAIDDMALEKIGEGDDALEPDAIREALNTSIGFTQASFTNNIWYSGQWAEQEWSENIEPYNQYLGKVMREAMAEYSWDDVEQRQTIAAFFPVFSPQDELVTFPSCATDWRGCIVGEITLSEPSLAQEDGRLKVSYSVEGARILRSGAEGEREEAQSAFSYAVEHWLAQGSDGWKIVATNNTATFFPVAAD